MHKSAARGPRLLLVSNSAPPGGTFLHHCKDAVLDFLNSHGHHQRLLFIPYAQLDHVTYTRRVQNALEPWGLTIYGIHEASSPTDAVAQADAILVGAGNTFRLLKALYDMNLVPAIRKRVLEDQIPYIGTSAGTLVATPCINTTNDMAVVFPPTLRALNLLPLAINAHFPCEPEKSASSDSSSVESRKKRILDFVQQEGAPPVLALPEGDYLLVENGHVTLFGATDAPLFYRDKEEALRTGSNLNISDMTSSVPTEVAGPHLA